MARHTGAGLYKGDKLLACIAFFVHSFHRQISSQLNTLAFDYVFLLFLQHSLMKIRFLLLLCSSTALVWGANCPQATGENDAQVIERYKATGQCSDVLGTSDTLDKRFAVKKKPIAPVVSPKKPTLLKTPPKNPPVSNPSPPAKPPTNPKSKASLAGPIGTRGAACMYCYEGKKKTPKTKPKHLARHDKYGAMFERAARPTKPGQQWPATQQPVCIKPPASDRTGKRSISGVARDLIFSRALIEKDSKVETVLGSAGTECICSVGK
jgi:hypothetical protein